MDRIGIIGMGRMGSAMAQRLAGQGASVTGWTRSGLSRDRAGALGIGRAATLADLVAASDTIITSLYDDAAVAEILDALLALDLSGTLIIETSTAIPQLLTSRAQALRDTGAAAVDAPISGGPEMVEAGTCGIFIGGAEGDVARARPTLGLITPRCLPVGPLGTGMVMKTINNSMMQAYVAALREMLPLASRAGIPLETVLSILNNGPAGMPMLQDRTAKILGQDDTVGFTVHGIQKDNEVFRRVVAAHGLTAETLAIAHAHQSAAIAAGLGDKDPATAIAHAYHSA